MNALRPRSRPDYRTACVTSRHHRRCSSVRSPAGVTRWHHGGRPAAAFHVPSAAAATAATNTDTGSRSRRVLRTPYRLRHRPATRRCGLILKSARVAGLAAAATDPALRKLHAWVSTALHPDRYGLRRFSCRSGLSSASAPARCVASSLRSCAHADIYTSPVWQPPPTAERLPQRRARAWQPGRRGAVFARGYTPQPARPPS